MKRVLTLAVLAGFVLGAVGCDSGSTAATQPVPTQGPDGKALPKPKEPPKPGALD